MPTCPIGVFALSLMDAHSPCKARQSLLHLPWDLRVGLYLRAQPANKAQDLHLLNAGQSASRRDVEKPSGSIVAALLIWTDDCQVLACTVRSQSSGEGWVLNYQGGDGFYGLELGMR